MLSVVTFSRPLRLVDISGEGAMQVGIDATIAVGRDYRVSQQWAAAFWAHPQRPDGILFESRHHTGFRSVAVFARRCAQRPTTAAVAANAEAEPGECVDAVLIGSFLHPDLVAELRELLNKYNVGLT